MLLSILTAIFKFSMVLGIIITAIFTAMAIFSFALKVLAHVLVGVLAVVFGTR